MRILATVHERTPVAEAVEGKISSPAAVLRCHRMQSTTILLTRFLLHHDRSRLPSNEYLAVVKLRYVTPVFIPFDNAPNEG